MTSIVVYDPGMTSGVVYAEFTAATMPVVYEKIEFEGGLDAISPLIARNAVDGYDVTVCERFRPTPRVYRAVEIEPLRIEGAVKAWENGVVWQYNDALLIGGIHGATNKNKRAADDVLRGLGLWSMPKEFPHHGDADDVNSAMKHLVAYLMRNDHRPMIEAVEEVRRGM